MKPLARTEYELPRNRVIRKRIAAKTTAVHLSALEPDMRVALVRRNAVRHGYVTRRAIPEKLNFQSRLGETKTFSRAEIWARVDKAGADLELDLLSGKAGQVAAFFSATGQGVYADYGRPTMDFAGFFRDFLTHDAVDEGVEQLGASSLRSGLERDHLYDLGLGPVLIVADAAGAAGLTALGHIARRADLANAAVVSDVISTGIYEGSSAWASAKIGVVAGAKALCYTSAIPVPGARPASILVGFVVGAAAAITAKRVANSLKDAAVDAADNAVAGIEGRFQVADTAEAL